MRVRSLILGLVFLSLACPGCRQENAPDSTDVTSPEQTPLTQSSFDQARRLLRHGIAHLENRNWADSETALQSLVELLPDNPTARRNLAILRVLSIVDPASPFQSSGTPGQQDEFTVAVEQAEAAISQWQATIQSDEDHSLADLLRGRLRVHADRPGAPSFESGIESLRQAVARQPRRADFHMALAQAMASRSPSTDSPELLDQLLKTFQLAPDNLYALQLVLQQQALSLRSTDPDTQSRAQSSIRTTLQIAAELVEPLNESVLSYSQVDLVELLQDALADESEDPLRFLRPAMIVANTMKAEVPVRIDQRRIDRHLLEYVQPRFDSAWTAQFQPPKSSDESGSSVLNGFQSSEVTIGGLADVTDLSFTDITLDGVSDLVAVCGGVVRVYSPAAADSDDWALSMQTPDTPQRWTSMLLADIDRDYDRLTPGQTHPQILEDPDQDRRVSTAAVRRVDTDADIIAWNDAALHIFRNTISDSNERTLQSVQEFPLDSITDVVAADADADGDLDLFVATEHGIRLLVNRDGTVFEPKQISSQPVNRLAVGDVDRNVAMDVVGISAETGQGLLQNLFHGRFRWLTAEAWSGTATPGSAIAIGDFDGNLSWDVVCGGPAGIVVHLTRSSAPGVVQPLESITLSTHAVTDVRLADLDNDGYQDIAALSDAGLEILRGTAEGRFVPLQLSTTDVRGTSLHPADVDDDGDLDLLVLTADGSIRLLTNDGGNQNHWMKIVVRGADNDDQFRSHRVNMHGTGTILEVVAGNVWQTQVVTEPVVHIGLGQAGRLDALRLIWPNGVPQNIVTDELLRAHVCLLAPQILKGSCPYIYTWNGEQFEFFSDCLWASPIGLVQASGDLAPTREWENLLIPGHQLRERDGEYVLQITEELWEIAYFDQVELLAIDHPPNLQVFTNEKVGPPDLAQHRIHTVQQPRTPRSVVDGRGQDLLPLLKQQDGDYAQAFTTRRLQGLTDEWTMEIDTGPLESADSIRLFLTGWIFPTDTSLNLQIHQNPNLTPPAPPSIEVLQADGNWKMMVPFFGFPGGKTKTMVVDLTGVVDPEHTRFRLRSTMELYFDHVFLTVGEQDQPVVSQPCRLTATDLHSRGFSRRDYTGSVFRNGHGPEGYNYQQLQTNPRWPTISGFFTRYGRVDELLQQADDRLAVLGPGDELTLRFAVPESPVPDGWTRDFVLRNTGWDKDADLNTVYGQSAEPYPYRGMTHYPFAEADSLPDSDSYRNYLQQYQTREYPPRRFRGLLRDRLLNDEEAHPAQAP